MLRGDDGKQSEEDLRRGGAPRLAHPDDERRGYEMTALSV